MFEVGKLITTNNFNGFKIIAINDSDIVVQDLLTLDFSVMSKTEHNYQKFDVKRVLGNCLIELLEQLDIAPKYIDEISNNMAIRFDKFIV